MALYVNTLLLAFRPMQLQLSSISTFETPPLRLWHSRLYSSRGSAYRLDLRLIEIGLRLMPVRPVKRYALPAKSIICYAKGEGVVFQTWI